MSTNFYWLFLNPKKRLLLQHLAPRSLLGLTPLPLNALCGRSEGGLDWFKFEFPAKAGTFATVSAGRISDLLPWLGVRSVGKQAVEIRCREAQK